MTMTEKFMLATIAATKLTELQAKTKQTQAKLDETTNLLDFAFRRYAVDVRLANANNLAKLQMQIERLCAQRDKIKRRLARQTREIIKLEKQAVDMNEIDEADILAENMTA